MLAGEELVSLANDVVVVPARHAWPEYREFHAYVCQPKRPFQRDGMTFPPCSHVITTAGSGESGIVHPPLGQAVCQFPVEFPELRV